MKKYLSILFFLSYSSIFSQERYSKFDYYKSTNLNIGYHYNFSEPHHKGFHLIDLGVNKLNYGGRHGAGYQYGVSTEIGLNTHRFIIAPKINGMIYYQFIVLGVELASYTNFKDANLRFIPFFGIGGDGFRLTINPQITLLNKNFQPINYGAANLSISIPLKKEKVK